MHVATTTRRYKDTVYHTHLLRRSVREGTKVRKETLANLSHLPDEAIEAIRRVLGGESLVAASEAFTILRSRPHGHVAAVWAQARALGLAALLGPACAERDMALALVIARVCRPGSKLATTRWWADTTLAADLGVAEAGTDAVYAAMDWLSDRQDGIEARLAARHLAPGGLVLFDLSGSYVEGRHNQLAATAYLALFGLLLIETITGFALDGIGGAQPAGMIFGWLSDFLGPQFLRLIHHLCMWFILAIAIFHIYSCVLVDHLEKNGLMSSIFTGYKFPTREEVLESRDGGAELLEELE